MPQGNRLRLPAVLAALALGVVGIMAAVFGLDEVVNACIVLLLLFTFGLVVESRVRLGEVRAQLVSGRQRTTSRTHEPSGEVPDHHDQRRILAAIESERVASLQRHASLNERLDELEENAMGRVKSGESPDSN